MIAIITNNNDTYSNPTINLIIERLFIEDEEVLLIGPEQQYKMKGFLKKPLEFVISSRLVKLPNNPFKIILSIFEYIKVSFLLKKNKIEKVLAVDPAGLVISGNLKKLNRRIKISYLSFEIFFSDELEESKWYKYIKRREIVYSNSVNSIIIQDENRKQLLINENKLNPFEKECISWFLIPVAPKKPIKIVNGGRIREFYGINKNTKAILHTGSLAAWSGAEYYISLLEKGLPDGHLLFLHSRYKLEKRDAIIDKLFDLQKRNYPIILHDVFIDDESEYYELISNFDYGISLYLPQKCPFTGKNIRNVGLSSGKFAYFMASGLPTIVSDQKQYRELDSKFHFGVLVNSIEDIINSLDNNAMGRISKECCIKLYEEVLNPQTRIANFVQSLQMHK